MSARLHNHTRIAAALAAGAGLTALALAPVAGGAAATTTEPLRPKLKLLAEHAPFPDDIEVRIKRKLDGQRTEVLDLKDPGHIAVARVVLEPGAVFPWHTHPGPVVISVAQGELVYQQGTDCIERTYATDEALIDPGDIVHTAWNETTGTTVLYATFYGLGEGESLMEPATNQDGWCE